MGSKTITPPMCMVAPSSACSSSMKVQSSALSWSTSLIASPWWRLGRDGQNRAARLVDHATAHAPQQARAGTASAADHEERGADPLGDVEDHLVGAAMVDHDI